MKRIDLEEKLDPEEKLKTIENFPRWWDILADLAQKVEDNSSFAEDFEDFSDFFNLLQADISDLQSELKQDFIQGKSVTDPEDDVSSDNYVQFKAIQYTLKCIEKLSCSKTDYQNLKKDFNLVLDPPNPKTTEELVLLYADIYKFIAEGNNIINKLKKLNNTKGKLI